MTRKFRRPISKELERAIEELKEREVKYYGECKHCIHAKSPEKNDSHLHNIKRVHCKINDFDIVEYYYCDRFEPDEDSYV